MRLAARFFALALLGSASCIVPAPSGDQASASNLPALTLVSGARFEDRVELVRALFRPGRVLTGESVRVALVFRVLAAVPEDYAIFVHMEDGGGHAERRNADHPPLGGARPTHTWKAGELLTDEFTIDPPPGATRLVNVWMGLWQPSRDQRLKVSNPQAVHTDGDNRVLIAQLPVGMP